MEIQECVETAIRKAISELLVSIDSQRFSEIMARAATLEFLKKKPLLTPGEVNQLYGIPVATLSTWRSRGVGPDYVKAEGSIFYKNCQIAKWLDKCEVHINVPHKPSG